MPKMLTVNNQKGWPHIQRLLVDLFQFMEPFLRNAELGAPVFLYKFYRFMQPHVFSSLYTYVYYLFIYKFINFSCVGSFSV